MLKPDFHIQPNIRLISSPLAFQEEISHSAHADLENISENTLIEKNQIEQPSEASTDRHQDNSADQFSDGSDELLDESSLKTVLDMLEVIDCVEELDLLETLTISQKKQVWGLTPEATRLKLKQIRAAALSSANARSLPSPLATHESIVSSEATATVVAVETSFHDEVDYIAEIDDVEDALDETSTDESDSSDLADAVPDILWQKATKSLAERQINQATEPLLQTGDRVVLHANPKLTMAEMIAIWEVLEVQGRYARITAKQVGTRNYPIAWMVLYPKPVLEARDDHDLDETRDLAASPEQDVNRNDIELGDNLCDNNINDDIEDDDTGDDDDIEF